MVKGGDHGKGGMHGNGGVHGEGGMCGEGHAWWWHAWQQSRPLQRAVRILLECILVT